MPFPIASPEQIAFFEEHGWLVVEDAIPGNVIDELAARCDELIDRKEALAYDWAWDKNETLEARSFKIVQSWPELVWPEIKDAPHRKWIAEFGGALMRKPMEFWYNQFLAKPPGNSAVTHWHQDEGYWGRNLEDKGITCWLPFHDVDVSNGCMHFIDGGHRDGVLEHVGVEGVASDLLRCSVDEARMIACPIKRGSVTFHHSKTPHMTPANISSNWRKILANHIQAVGAGGEGDHYKWRIHVNQRTGERREPGR